MKAASLFLFALLAVTLRAEPYFFKPPGWAVGTEFPSEPKVMESRIPKPEGDIVESRAVLESASEAFAVTRIQNPVAIEKDRLAEAYDGAKNGMLRATRATLVSEEKIEMLGRDSRRYACTFNGGAMICQMRMIIIGDELFMFMHVQPKGQPSSTAANAFFEKISEKKKG